MAFAPEISIVRVSEEADWANIEAAVPLTAGISYCTAAEPDACSWSVRVTFDEVQTGAQVREWAQPLPLEPNFGDVLGPVETEPALRPLRRIYNLDKVHCNYVSQLQKTINGSQ